MKKILLVVLLLFAVFTIKAQTITDANFVLAKQGRGIRAIQLVLDDKIEIVITGDGKIKDVISFDDYSDRNLEEMGYRVEYYSNFDIHDKPGLIKSIGNIVFKYNNSFDIHDVKGTLKSVGDIKITYYNTFDIHDPQGRVKSIGDVQIKYYNKFDINDRFGEIKSITGNTNHLSVGMRPILFR